MTSRRTFIASAAAAWVAFEWRDLAAVSAQAARAATQTPPQPFKTLTPKEAAEIDALTAQIIPSDGTPGAREAHVVRFVDGMLSGMAKDQLPAFRDGLAKLPARVAKVKKGEKSFAALSPKEQIAVLTAMDKDHEPFFEALRGATLTGMLASPEYGGNFQKIGWKWIGFNDQFSWTAPFGAYDR